MNRRDLFKMAGKVGIVAAAQLVPWEALRLIGITDADYIAEAAALPQNYTISSGTSLMSGADYASYSIVSNPSGTGYVSSVTGPDGETWLRVGLTGTSSSVTVSRDLGAGGTRNIQGGADDIYWRMYVPSDTGKKNMQIATLQLASGANWFTNTAAFRLTSAPVSGEQTGFVWSEGGENVCLQDFSTRSLGSTLNKAAVRFISFQVTSNSSGGAEMWVKEVRYGVRTRPKIIFYFDDQHITQYTVAKPILDAHGLKAVMCVSGNALTNLQGTGIYMTEENVQELFDDGYDVVSHSWAHGSYGSMTAQQIYDDALRCKNLIDARGWNRNGSQHLITYPNGSAPAPANMSALTSLGYTYGRGARTYNAERYHQHTYGGVDFPMRLLTWGLSRPPINITAMANNGAGLYRVTAAAHGFSSNEWVVVSGTSTTADGTWQVAYVSSSQFDLVGSTFGGNATGVVRYSWLEWDRRVDLAIRLGSSCHVLVHQVGASGAPADVGYVTDAEFTPFIQSVARKVAGGLLDWSLYSDWVRGLTYPRRRRAV